MTEETRTTSLEGTTDEPSGLSDAELEALGGEELPDREAMALINANVAAPVNAAIAAFTSPTTFTPSLAWLIRSWMSLRTFMQTPFPRLRAS